MEPSNIIYNEEPKIFIDSKIDKIEETNKMDNKIEETSHGAMHHKDGMVTTITSPSTVGGEGEVNEVGKGKIPNLKKSNSSKRSVRPGVKRTTSLSDMNSSKNSSEQVMGKINLVKSNSNIFSDNEAIRKRDEIEKVDEVDIDIPEIDNNSEVNDKKIEESNNKKNNKQIDDEEAEELNKPKKLTPEEEEAIKLQKKTINLDEVKALETDAQNSDKASLEILTKMSDKLKEIGFDEINIDPKLAPDNNSSFEVEPFTIKDQTLYRIKVTYTLKAKNPGTNEKKEYSFTRTISTNAPNPKDAVLVAANFTEMVCDLVKNPNSMKKDFQDAAKSHKLFTFKFNKNAAGGFTSLQTITAMKDKDTPVASHSASAKSQTKYTYDFKTREYNPIINDTDIKPGQQVFATEAHRMLHERRVSVKNDKFYDELEKNGMLLQHTRELQEEIKKMQEEFTRIKNNFIQDPSFKFFRKNQDPIDTKGFEDFKAKAMQLYSSKDSLEEDSNRLKDEDRALKEDLKEFEALQKGISDRSVDVDNVGETEKNKFLDKAKNYISLTDPILENKNIAEALPILIQAIKDKEQDIAKDLSKANTQLDTVKKQINQTIGNFNEQLEKMNQINRDLGLKVDQLEKLKTKANNSQSADKQLEAVKKAISDDEITKLKSKIQKHEEAIEKIIDHFGNDFSKGNSIILVEEQ